MNKNEEDEYNKNRLFDINILPKIYETRKVFKFRYIEFLDAGVLYGYSECIIILYHIIVHTGICSIQYKEICNYINRDNTLQTER